MKSAHDWAILRVLRFCGFPIDAEQIARFTHQNDVTTIHLTAAQVRRRMPGLVAAGRVLEVEGGYRIDPMELAYGARR